MKKPTRPRRFTAKFRHLLSRVPFVEKLITFHQEYTPGAKPLLSAAGLDSLEGAFNHQDGHQVTIHARRCAYRVSLLENGRTSTFYVKLVGFEGPKQVIESLFRLRLPISKCRREWEFSRRLESLGIGAQRLEAFGDARIGFWPLESFLIVRQIDGALPLVEFLAGLPPASDSAWRARRALSCQLAAVIAKMHSARIVHRDLYCKHVLVTREGQGFAINIIDLQRTTQGGGLSAAVRDLAALNASVDYRHAGPLERLRFLRHYVRLRWPSGGVSLKKLLRRVEQRSDSLSGRGRFRGINWRPGGAR